MPIRSRFSRARTGERMVMLVFAAIVVLGLLLIADGVWLKARAGLDPVVAPETRVGGPAVPGSGSRG